MRQHPLKRVTQCAWGWGRWLQGQDDLVQVPASFPAVDNSPTFSDRQVSSSVQWGCFKSCLPCGFVYQTGNCQVKWDRRSPAGSGIQQMEPGCPVCVPHWGKQVGQAHPTAPGSLSRSPAPPTPTPYRAADRPVHTGVLLEVPLLLPGLRCSAPLLATPVPSEDSQAALAPLRMGKGRRWGCWEQGGEWPRGARRQEPCGWGDGKEQGGPRGVPF